MDLEQLVGRYSRLQRELSAAYSMLPWHSARIDRLANDLAATERQIAALQASGGQRVHAMLGVAQRADTRSERASSLRAEGEHGASGAKRAVPKGAAASGRSPEPRA
jgi:membrane protein required for beta-lactamase induction